MSEADFAQLERKAIVAESEPAIDLDVARLYIEALTGDPGTPMTFQVFDDNDPEKKDPKGLKRVLHGTLAKCARELTRLNGLGAGIFITVNQTDGKGRKTENIVAVRALFTDHDSGAPEAYALKPSFIVQSKAGPHAYWLLAPGTQLDDFRDAQKQLAAFYQSDPTIHDLPRVMRLPGFIHRKGAPFFVGFLDGTRERYTVEEVLAEHPVTAKVLREAATPIAASGKIPRSKRHAAWKAHAARLRNDGSSPEQIYRLLLKYRDELFEAPEEKSDKEARDLAQWFEDADARAPLVGSANGDTAEAQVRYLSDVKRQDVEWLWKPRIPIGFITMLDGDPEKAKSTITLDIAARGSRGREFPDGQPIAASFKTVILSAEDPAEMVIRPRIDQFGGDPSMIAVVESVRLMRDGKKGEPQLIDLTTDLPAVAVAILQVRPRLVIVDPITAYLGKTDSFKDSAVRSALAPLATLAAKLAFAILVVRHLNKNVSYADVLYRGGGSIGFIGAARSGLMAIADPDEEGRLLLAHYKGNLAPKGATLAYKVVPALDDPEQPALLWLGADPRSARKLHEAGHETAEDKSARGDARHFLRETLADGEMKTEDVFADARKAGHSIRTLKRAKFDLKVAARKVGFSPSVWYWKLP